MKKRLRLSVYISLKLTNNNNCIHYIHQCHLKCFSCVSENTDIQHSEIVCVGAGGSLVDQTEYHFPPVQ